MNVTGDQLRKAIELAGFARQQDAADFLGVELRTVQRWIASESTVPLSVVHALAVVWDSSESDANAITTMFLDEVDRAARA